MRRFHLTPSLVISLVALSVALSGTSVAATGTNFILGSSNTADKPTALTASAAGAALKVTNSSPKPAAAFSVPAGVTPLTVNSATKVKNLNADLLDGVDSTGFLAANGKAKDADHADQADNASLLGGLSPIEFMAGEGSGNAYASAASPGLQTNDYFMPGVLQIGYTCPVNLATAGQLQVHNLTVSTLNMFTDSGAANTTYQQVAPAAVVVFAGNPSGESWTFRMQGESGPGLPFVVTVQVATVQRASDCHFQAQGVITYYQ